MDDAHSGALVSVVYMSSARKAFTTIEMMELLKTARLRNAELGVTGMLMYKDRKFMQVLEGPESSVRPLLEKIGGDPRHFDVLVMRDQRVTARDFPNWSMALGDLSNVPAELADDVSDFLTRSFSKLGESGAGTAVYKLMLAFRRAVA